MVKYSREPDNPTKCKLLILLFVITITWIKHYLLFGTWENM
ncbi:hypothetical protein ERO13_D08G258501v2 [Gossypium hirsutum]|uniref:Uncharacterized protein n=2 Tax=Gossypium TaxID=3633 RepID=A0A5D2U398_GOSMU|nr:hypothetical protein ERO13_D08G258501v2 [Gossypium hirsutum]TYG59369.1 hypothetical protein ES288_D08G297100v1 [Gossypium darwinii]TYI71338.1 hypothetical protein E1A91_D08G287700v1 [Gossypium mustelinum]